MLPAGLLFGGGGQHEKIFHTTGTDSKERLHKRFKDLYLNRGLVVVFKVTDAGASVWFRSARNQKRRSGPSCAPIE